MLSTLGKESLKQSRTGATFVLHIITKVLSLFLIIVFVSISSVACTTNPPDTAPEEIPENIIYLKTEEGTAKYLRHEVLENFHFRDQLVVYFEFTNTRQRKYGSDSFFPVFYCRAFQNGVEIRESLDWLDDNDNDSSKDIRRGKTAEIYVMFYLKDRSDVELKLSSVNSDGIYEDSMILSLE